MKFKIYGTANGVEDCVVIEGETVDEIRGKAAEEVASRGWADCWSEEVG